jgi:hypothetical protein
LISRCTTAPAFRKIQGEASSGVALRIEANEKNAVKDRQGGSEIDCGSRLANETLLFGDRDDE